MKEIEVKIKVASFEPIIRKLEELGCVVAEPIIQKDVVFEKKEVDPTGRCVLGIREAKNIYTFTLKKDVSGELDCIEKETQISDPEAMREIIGLLGYAETVRVNKKRRKCNYKDYEICLDDVEGLRLFVEVEKFSDDDVKIVMDELMSFVVSLGVDVAKRVLHGYDTLLEQKLDSGK